jgi:hypothetical protein
VVSALTEEISVATYVDRMTFNDPGAIRVEPTAGDVVLSVNFFGLRDARFAHAHGHDVIEDHSHDPWSSWAKHSRATFAIASLRKTLPIPDGGILWSPSGQAVPESTPETDARARASTQKLSGMVLKSLYLAGHNVTKDDFRKLTLAGEAQIASGPISGMPLHTRAILDALPVEEWREGRSANHAHLVRALADLDEVSVATSRANGSVPFSVMLICSTPARREHVKKRMLEARVYPAVLWPLHECVVDGVTEEDRDLAQRILSVHCDFRYAEADLDRVASVIRGAANEAL